MKILVNIFHPEINQSVANKTWLEKLKEHPEITTRLLYSDYPDWKINIQKEQNLLTSHDRIVFQHPFYWYSCPPLMKKWLDEVLTYD